MRRDCYLSACGASRWHVFVAGRGVAAEHPVHQPGLLPGCE